VQQRLVGITAEGTLSEFYQRNGFVIGRNLGLYTILA